MPHDQVEQTLAALEIETPSWGYGDSGTRFATFQHPGRPRDVFERLDDAAEVHRLTGSAPAVALHFPWDRTEDLAALREHASAAGLRIGAVNPNLFQDPDYRLGSITHADAAVRAKAVEHLLECIRIATELGSGAQSLWFADGTNYPGQGDLIARRHRMRDALAEVYAALPQDQELLLEYKLFEPAFYATDLADWGSALLLCQGLGDRARVLVDLGHHAQGTNIEQIVAILDDEGRLGGFHFNNRKYADDDLIVGSVNPFELFLILAELAAPGRSLPRLTIDQAHNVEAKVEAMVLSIVNLQEAYAKALLVDRDALAAAQEAGDVLGAHEVLLDAYRSDVGPCARAPVPPTAPPRTPWPRCAPPDTSSGSPRSEGPPSRWPEGGAREHPRGDDRLRRGPLAVVARRRARRPARAGRARVAPAGENRAVANFGGGNTSAKGTATDHVGREIDVMWVKGSGSDLATMGPQHFTPLRMDEMLAVFDRDEMPDEDMVAHLARCQVDPAAPRSSIETLLHAFVPAPHVHHTHPDGINVLAGTRDGERLVAECFGDAAAWIPYIRPGFTLAKQVGAAVRDNPALELVILAKHGLVVWGTRGGGVPAGVMGGGAGYRGGIRLVVWPAGLNPNTPAPGGPRPG
jgi:L-rhamnose isomerase/sugar isomerase